MGRPLLHYDRGRCPRCSHGLLYCNFWAPFDFDHGVDAALDLDCLLDGQRWALETGEVAFD